MKRCVAFCISIIIILSSFSYAIPGVKKTETVYANMGYYGDIEQIIVSNEFSLFGQECIKDYASYKDMIKYTDVEYDKGTNTFNTKGIDRLAYSGKIDNSASVNIPWNFDISYKLNGVETQAEKLLNANGLVEIIIDINPNEEADEYFKNNYILEITSSYDMNNYLSVESDDAIEVSTGQTKTLMFVVLPGQSKTITIKLGSEKFENDGLTFAMLALSGDILDKIYELVEDKEDFEEAVEALNDSTDVVLYAVNSMTNSILTMQEGMEVLKRGANNLYDTSESRNDNIKSLKNNIENIGGLVNTSKSDIKNIQNEVNDLNDLLVDMDKHLKVLIKDVDYLESDLEEFEESVEKLPDDLMSIQYVLQISKNLIGNLQSLLNAQSKADSIDTDGIKENILQLTNEIKKVYKEAMQVEDEIVRAELLGAVANMQAKLTELADTLSELENLSNLTDSSTKSLYNNLSNLSKRLGFINSRLDEMIEDDSEIIIDLYKTGEDLIEDLNDTLKTLKKYSERFIDNKDNIPEALDNVQDLLDEIQNTCSSMALSIGSLEDILKVLDNEIYNSTIKITDGLIDASDKLTVITSEADDFRRAKDKAKNVIKNKWDDIDEKTTLFKVDPDAEPISFSSIDNDSPVKVQIMLKTPEIKEKTIDVEDLEAQLDNGNIWSRIAAVFEKIFDIIKSIFGK